MLGLGARQSTLPLSSGPAHRLSKSAALSQWRHTLLQYKGSRLAACTVAALVLLLVFPILRGGGSRRQQAAAAAARAQSARTPSRVAPVDEEPLCRLFRPPKRAPWAFNIAIIGMQAMSMVTCGCCWEPKARRQMVARHLQ